MQNSIGDATLTLNSVDSSIIHDVSNGSNVLSTGWPRATLVCRPNSHPFQVRVKKTTNRGANQADLVKMYWFTNDINNQSIFY